MGGRGSWSASAIGKGLISMTKIGGAKGNHEPEKRQDVLTMFSNAGIAEVSGTQDFDTAVIGAFAIQLGNLEKKYGAIGDSSSVEFVGMSGGSAKGSVSYSLLDPTSMVLSLNSSHLGNIGNLNATLKSEQESGFKVKTDGSILNQARYTVTHEYGHMLENVLYAKAKASGYKGSQGQYNAKVKKEIQGIAKTYRTKRTEPSGYGGSNSAEFFAESFASANLGRPSAYGKAMNKWLKSQGF